MVSNEKNALNGVAVKMKMIKDEAAAEGKRVVDWTLQLAATRQPVTLKMALQLINCPVEGMEAQGKVHK
jgi:hypothetical protein